MKDSIVEAVKAKYTERSETGMAKYGTTLDRNDLSTEEWLQHAQEEAMDLTLYLEKVMQKIRLTNDS